MSPYSAFDNNPVFWADPSGAAPELGSVFEQSGMKVTSFAVQGTGVGIGAAGNDPPAKRTTQIVQSFKYDKTQQGTKTPSGTDYIRESEVTVSQNVNGDGKYVTRTITSITTVSIDSKGKINENNITKTVIVHSEISNNKGDIKYENTTATGTVEFNNLSPAMQTATTNAATEKSNLGHSPLQDKADNINLGINLTVGAAATVATGGTSTVVQVVAGVAGSIVADKALPEVNAEQVSKELYYKQEVLK